MLTHLGATVGQCAICGVYRELKVDGNLYRLPLSGESVSAAMARWWQTRGPAERTMIDSIGPLWETPLCEPCLDLVVDVEQIQAVCDDFFDRLWRKMLSSGVLTNGGHSGTSLPSGIYVTQVPLEVEPAPLVEQLDRFGHCDSSATPAVDAETDVMRNTCEERAPSPMVELKRENSPDEEDNAKKKADYGCIVVQRKRGKNGKRPELTVIAQVEAECYDSPHEDREPLVVEGISAKKKRPNGTGRTVKRKETANSTARRICPTCGLLIKGNDVTLKKHIKLVHNKEKVVQCQFCPERFVYYKHMYIHQAKVHDHNVDRFTRQCELCGKVIFSEKRNVNNHMLHVHGITPKEDSRQLLKCPHCSKQFLCKNKLADHMNMHEGIRPYGCPLCPVRMVKFANLQQHARRVHDRIIKMKKDTPDGFNCVLV